MGVRDRIELGFRAWAALVVRHAWLALVGVALATGAMLAALPRLQIDTSDESFLREADPVRLTHNSFKRQFGNHDGVFIALRPPEIFELGFLERLGALHRDLEDVPQIQEVTSLINARHTYGNEQELIVEDLMESWPKTRADLRLRPV